MKQTRLLMGMPVTVEIVDAATDPADADRALNAVYDYMHYVDDKFSTFKEESEISRINRGEITLEVASEDMRSIFALAELTRQETDGYFDIAHAGRYDPSGIVKGWAIYNAAGILRQRGLTDFYIDAGGDIEAAGKNSHGENWRVGIRNPFNATEIVKVLAIADGGVATSGTYVRGQHIYNPRHPDQPITEIVSLTVIGPNVYEADRFATAAFAMGRDGIYFVEELDGLEGYMIDANGQATYTTGFERFVKQ